MNETTISVIIFIVSIISVTFLMNWAFRKDYGYSFWVVLPMSLFFGLILGSLIGITICLISFG